MSVHAPVIAAIDPQSPAQAPVEFGIAASRVSQSPLIVAAVGKADADSRGPV